LHEIARHYREMLSDPKLLSVDCIFLILALTMQAGPPRSGQMPTLPLTQLDDRALADDLDKRAFSLTFAQPVPIKDLLLLLVRGTALSVVPDPGITGSFIGDLKNVSVRQALDLILPPLGLASAIDGTVIRVFKREPETRIFDLNYIAAERSSTTSVGGEGSTISTTTRADVFEDLAKGVQTLLTGEATFNVDRKAGLLQATDFPERLDRVALYLEAVQDRLHRQVQIDARVIEIEPGDDNAAGVDWAALAAQLAGTQTAGQRAASRRALTGLRVTDMSRFMSLLEAQGKVATLASPRMLTMNNEPSIVRTDRVMFTVTPQISSDAIVTLSVTPMVKAPEAAESDMLARVADGETLVISGFTREHETRERKAVGISGGWFGRSTVVTKKRVELIILLTPRIVTGVMAP
jgi:type II secretory pathway component GspD/PulD (secretin)